MKNKPHQFIDFDSLTELIHNYFKYLEGEYHLEKRPLKKAGDATDITEQKIWDREPEPATIAGLAFFLGFNSLEEFDNYEKTGKYASAIKRARLQVEAAYEKKLHFQSSTGAIFALKSMGWNEKPEAATVNDSIKTLEIKIIESGPQPASSEKEVTL